MTKIEGLLKLISENPDLEIIPLVHEEIVADDSYTYWLGSWGRSEIAEYYLGREKIHFKDDDEEDILNDLEGREYGCDHNGTDIYDLSDEEWDALYASVPWKKAIVVHIESP